MNPVQYLFLNRDLRMSPGKLAAQAAHAAVLSAFNGTIGRDDPLVAAWMERADAYGGGQAKVTLLAEDAAHLRAIREYLERRGYRTFSVIDEGATEVPPGSFTALSVPVVDRDDPYVQRTFGDFALYTETPPPPPRWPFSSNWSEL